MGGVHSIFLSLLVLFTSANTWAVESKLLHITVKGMKLTSKIDVPDGEYDLDVVLGLDGITGFHFHGRDVKGMEQDVQVPLSEVKGGEKSFAQTWMPGSPYSFSARVPADFDAKKGGAFRLHALSDWKWMMFKKYGYKDFDVLIDVEIGSVRASLKKGNKIEKFSKLTIDVGLIGASFKTE